MCGVQGISSMYKVPQVIQEWPMEGFMLHCELPVLFYANIYMQNVQE